MTENGGEKPIGILRRNLRMFLFLYSLTMACRKRLLKLICRPAPAATQQSGRPFHKAAVTEIGAVHWHNLLWLKLPQLGNSPLKRDGDAGRDASRQQSPDRAFPRQIRICSKVLITPHEHSPKPPLSQSVYPPIKPDRLQPIG